MEEGVKLTREIKSHANETYFSATAAVVPVSSPPLVAGGSVFTS